MFHLPETGRAAPHVRGIMMKPTLRQFVTALLLTSAAMPSITFAQEAEEEDQINSADIIVTARKREEDAQTVPIAPKAWPNATSAILPTLAMPRRG
jgi:hypothetical protein